MDIYLINLGQNMMKITYKNDTMNIAVQINGKTRGRCENT